MRGIGAGESALGRSLLCCGLLCLALISLCFSSFYRADDHHDYAVQELSSSGLHLPPTTDSHSSSFESKGRREPGAIRPSSGKKKRSSKTQKSMGPREAVDWKQMIKPLRGDQHHSIGGQANQGCLSCTNQQNEDYKSTAKRGNHVKRLKFKTFKAPGVDNSTAKFKDFRNIETSGIQFAHIPKTGGESMAIILRRSFPKDKVNHGQLCFSDLYRPTAVNIVFVRDPLSHVKSQFLFCRDTDWGRQHRSPNFPLSNNEYDDYLAWLRNFQSLKSSDIGHLHDYNCMDPRNTLTRHLSCSGTPPMPPGGSGHPPQHGLDQPLNEARAKENLDQATIVGVTSYMQQSVCMLFEHYQKPCPSAAQENHGVRSSKTRLLGNETIDSIVRDLTQKDERVYKHGLAKFKKQLNLILGRTTRHLV